jgi:hypothetical protein
VCGEQGAARRRRGKSARTVMEGRRVLLEKELRLRQSRQNHHRQNRHQHSTIAIVVVGGTAVVAAVVVAVVDAAVAVAAAAAVVVVVVVVVVVAVAAVVAAVAELMRQAYRRVMHELVAGPKRHLGIATTGQQGWVQAPSGWTRERRLRG